MNKTFAVVALASFAAAASADTVNMSFVGTGRGDNARVSSPSGTSNVFVGQLRHSITGGAGLGTIFTPGEYRTFCADLSQYVSGTSSTFQVVGVNELSLAAPMGLDKAEAIERLFTYTGGTEVSASASNEFAQAFQLTIWEIIHDYSAVGGAGSLSIATGNFHATKTNGGAFGTTVNNYLSTFFNAAASGPASTPLLGLGSANRQDQIVHVPAPGAAALAGMGLLLVGVRRRKN